MNDDKFFDYDTYEVCDEGDFNFYYDFFGWSVADCAFLRFKQ